MVTTKNIYVHLTLALCLTALQFFSPVYSKAESTSTESVAILPFEVHAAQDLSYLRNGIRDMLASRLATGVGVTIISKSQIDSLLGANANTIQPDTFQSLAKQLNASYLVAGSYTSLGGGASIDAKVYSASLRTMQDFYATAPGQTDVIMAINNLAWEIGEKIFGKTKPAQAVRGSQPALTAQAQQPVPVYRTAHPERAYLGNSGPGSPFIKPVGVGGTFGFTKSQNFRMDLKAMDIGDIDGDGLDDAVLADQQKIQAFRIIDGKFILMGEWTISPRYRIHYISLADLNKNGKAEIYISSNDVNEPNSLALEWSGESFSPLFSDARWYVRAMDIPGSGPTLVGQKGAMEYSFEPGIFKLDVRENSRLKRSEKIQVPDKLNIFDFVFYDLEADGRHELISVDQNDHIRISKQNGKQLWVSSDYYGGTKRYVGKYEPEVRADLPTAQERYFIPSRLIVSDLNNDTTPDILLNKNLSSASRVMHNFKSYPAGEIHALAWNGIALAELWHTSKIDGYIADYQLRVDLETKKAMLYVGVILNSGIGDMFSASNSTILMYPLDLGSQENKQKTQ